MKKKIKDLTDEEIIERLADDICKYCPYESITTPEGERDCPKRVVCYGGEPIYPLCMGGNIDKDIADNFRNETNPEVEIEVEE